MAKYQCRKPKDVQRCYQSQHVVQVKMKQDTSLLLLAMRWHSYLKTGQIINLKLRNYICIGNTCLNNKSNTEINIGLLPLPYWKFSKGKYPPVKYVCKTENSPLTASSVLPSFLRHWHVTLSALKLCLATTQVRCNS